MLNRRRFLQLSAAAGVSAGSVGLWTWQVEPHWLELVERGLPVERLPRSWRGGRLVQLSDLHLGARVADDYLIETFRRVRDLAPEIVVYTGDLTSHETEIDEHLARLLPEFARGCRATVAVFGNHDFGPGWAHPEVAARLRARLEAAGITVLSNEVAGLEGLEIVGLGDLWAGQFDVQQALARRNPRHAAIALSHNPDTVDLEGWGDYRGWILAGHTHGGQCKPPFLDPPLLPVRNRRYTAGEFELAAGRRMYISRGVGHTAQVRFNVRPEATLFELVPA